MPSNNPSMIVKTDDATEVMRVDSSGKLGINTTTPTHPLHVNSNTGLRQNSLYLSGGNGWSSLSYNAHHNDANSQWVFPEPSHAAVTIEMDDHGGLPRLEVFSTTTAAPTTWTQRLAIDGNSGNVLMGQSGGNVGIGTATPKSLLQVRGDLALEKMAAGPPRLLPANATMIWNDGMWLRLNQNLDYSKPIFGVHTPGLFAPGSLNVGGANGWGDPGGGNAWFTGSVGIGTTTPARKLHVENTEIHSGGSGAGFSFGNRETAAFVDVPGSGERWVWYSSRGMARLWSASDKLAITSTGNVGIGLREPRTQLHVFGRIATGLDFNSPGSITFYPPDGFAWFHIDNGPAGGRPIGTLRFSYGGNPGDALIMSMDQRGNVNIPGSLWVNGPKHFVEEHPTDRTKQIVYASLEGGEAGTYTRGTWKLENGKAVIELSEHFGMVTSEDGLTVQLTPHGEWLQLYVVQLTTRQLLVQEAQGKSGQFGYLVQGVRKGYEHYEVIQQRKEY